ncbi:MAG: isoprenylcysteine carboxylmethyltransferase family protein [Anaerolineales bacterium]|nr:isoprenylcysteine carboxylmethyltransferase family protein [Anaerolineales bacterium]
MNDKKSQSPAVTRWLVREIMGVMSVAVILFWSAGRWDWWMGWGVTAVYALWVAANAILIIPRSPELLVERASRNLKGVKSWDNVLLGIIGLLTIVKYVIAGLDVRYGWSAPFAIGVPITALIMAALGYAVVTWSMVANAFFSTVVRIQEDRGQQVCTTGPYRFVRHPGYVGSAIFELAVPIALGSWCAFVAGLLIAIFTVVRTAMEDRTLQAELDGYQTYAQNVRYRLIPGIW